MKDIVILDSTLRDGAQSEGISFSVEDKLKIVCALDELGIRYIEAGNPGSNPKDMQFFERVKGLHLKRSKIAAFGSTRHKDLTVHEDKNIQSLLVVSQDTVVIFGKSWDFHVTHIIKTTLDNNLKMIEETIAFFREHGKSVIFDAEHFFDGYKYNKEYAIRCLEAAVNAGAGSIVLCDTNGGAFPSEVFEATKEVVLAFRMPVGIHCHNDCGMAVANSVMAVEAGATHVQGTILGLGERCGNTNLSTIIPTLQIKKSLSCIPQSQLKNMSKTARFIADISNVKLYSKEPYVGRNAFAHKGGMHIDGVSKHTKSFEHIEPSLVGNERRFLTSEVAGRSTIIEKIRQISPELTKHSQETKKIIAKLKQMELEGYQFEAAEDTFELMIRKQLGKYKPFFELVKFKIIGERPYERDVSASALIKIIVDGKPEITAAEGDGPVNALDKALRKALEVFYPQLSKVHLIDYKVRVLDGSKATASKVRVLIESSDGETSWVTVGVSNDILEASFIALVDSIEYKLIKDMEKEEEQK